jgi:SAM-dependent methyltransferase
MENKIFTTEKESLQFYEERYNAGYMEDWDPVKKKRVLQLIAELNLPARGKALDFGCGNGVLTHVIKTALPEWEVYGCDVSEIAINNAANKLPHLNFFVHDGTSELHHQFDFIFTHHVFEHVYDLTKSWKELAQYGNENSIIVHILPCGNKHSFEYDYCLLCKNGINKDRGNRFFFEDEGHLRRMTTEEMEKFARINNYVLFKQCYANQYYGALNWISNSGDQFIDEFTSTKNAIDKRSERKIKGVAKKIKLINRARYYSNQSLRQDFGFFSIFSIRSIAGVLRKLVYRFVANYYKTMIDLEWNYFRRRKNGSEMFLFFRKADIKNAG